MRAHQRGLAAAVLMYSGMGVGSDCGCSAGVLRLGVDLNMQEVKMMRVRMVCIRLPKFLGGMVRMLAGRRRN